MSEVEVNFRSSLHEITVRLTGTALRTIEKNSLAAGSHETGGILIGSYDLEGRTATVSEATTKSIDSRAGRTWFQRGVRGLSDILRLRWSIGQYYVGEWHSHPGGAPEPSMNDIREMQAVSKEFSYQCPRPIMIIAGTEKTGIVKLSASVMKDGVLIRLVG
ncbi:Mov34/MPN/PAD-1 family protein [Pararhizobium gei]|uniref:Mov34/MPN/PAD-1 family protein n=1 Tax=Pararhizobium gei TaxID=1395951 RepID=UPI0023DB1BAE|nr:Mov34/MPN/PAD-1 family protein [Rhizobium gei]